MVTSTFTVDDGNIDIDIGQVSPNAHVSGLIINTAPPNSFITTAYSDSAISTNGALIGALNATTDETVNTVDFTGVSAAEANAGPVSLDGTVTVDIFSQSTGTSALGSGTGLTDSFFYSIGAGTGDLTFNNLTAGQWYELQMVFDDTRARLVDIYANQDNNSGIPDVDGLNVGLGASKLVTVTFTAGASGTQSFYIDNRVAAFPGHLNALQLRAVEAIPEPSTFALCGLGALCLGVFGWRRRK